MCGLIRRVKPAATAATRLRQNLRYATPVPDLTLAAYVDWGEVELSKSYGQHRGLAGWGLGLQYAKADDYYLRLDYARKLGSEEFTSEESDKNGRLWFLAYKLFLISVKDKELCEDEK